MPMGAGKTICTFATIEVSAATMNCSVWIVIVPSTLAKQWESEAKSWLNVNVVVLSKRVMETMVSRPLVSGAFSKKICDQLGADAHHCAMECFGEDEFGSAESDVARA